MNVADINGSIVPLAARQAWALQKTISITAAVNRSTGIVLAADVGGTNSRFMLYDVDTTEPVQLRARAPGKLLFAKKYANVGYPTFAHVVGEFFKDAVEAKVICESVKPDIACFAVAGVAEQNKCRLTNLDWLIDGPELQDQFGISFVEIINDFVAQGYGVLTLADDEVIQLAGPEPVRGGVVGLVGAGTGLGQCFLAPSTTGEYQAFPSEGGHAEFAPRGPGSDETQIDLLKYLKVKFSGWNRISFERVVSGKGICNVYEFLAYSNPHRIDKAVHDQFLASSQEDASIIVKNAIPGTLCYEALQLFGASYGAVCGTFALQVMPFGGLYISGGVTAHLQSFLRKDPNFLEAYHDKGRVSPMLQDIPLFFVKGDEMGQRGAHLRAVRLLHHHREGLGLPRTEGRNVHLAPPRDASVGNFLKKINAEVGGFFTKTVSDMISSGARPPYDRSEPYSLPALGPYGKHGEYDISGSLACFVLALIGLQRVRINTLRSRVTFQPQVLRLQEPLRHV